MGHTKWPFRVEIIEREGINDYAIVDANGKRVADTLGSDFGVERDNNLNALLIVACVNGCAGLARPDRVPDLIGNLRMMIAWAAQRELTRDDENMLEHVANVLLRVEGGA